MDQPTTDLWADERFADLMRFCDNFMFTEHEFILSDHDHKRPWEEGQMISRTLKQVMCVYSSAAAHIDAPLLHVCVQYVPSAQIEMYLCKYVKGQPGARKEPLEGV